MTSDDILHFVDGLKSNNTLKTLALIQRRDPEDMREMKLFSLFDDMLKGDDTLESLRIGTVDAYNIEDQIRVTYWLELNKYKV